MAAQDKSSTHTVITSEDFLQNAAWVKSKEGLFATYDKDKDGLVTINDYVFNKRLFAHLNLDSQVYEKYRTAACNFAASLGIYPGISLNKEEFVKNAAAHAQREIESANKGEGSLLHRRGNSLLALGAKSQDWTISLEEYLSIFQSLDDIDLNNILKAKFNAIDTNKIGRLGIKEISDHAFKYFYSFENLPGKDLVDTFFEGKKFETLY